MRQKHSFTALVALLIIVIDTDAQEHLLNKNKLHIQSDNADPPLNAYINNELNEVYGDRGEDMDNENIANGSFNEFNSISKISNTIVDKKEVGAQVDNSIFSYPLSLHKRKIGSNRYWLTNDLSRSALPVSRVHTDMTFSQPPNRKLVRQQQTVHVSPDVTISSNNEQMKRNTYVNDNVNKENKTSGEIDENYSNVINIRHEKQTVTGMSTLEYETPSGKISISNQFVKFDASEMKKKKKNINQLQISLSDVSNLFNDEAPISTHYQLLGIDKGTESTVTKTSDTTFKVPLKVLAKSPSSPPCVKPETRLSNEESRDKNQSIEPIQLQQFTLNKRFPEIPMTIETFSSKTKSNTHDIERQIFSNKVISSAGNSNESLNLESSEVSTSQLYQNSSTISEQFNRYIKVVLPSPTYDISSVSRMTNPNSSDIEEHGESSMTKSHWELANDANISPTIELYSGDNKLYEEDTSNVIPLETTTTIENVTSPIATVTPNDKELRDMADASKNIESAEALIAIKHNRKRSLLHHKVGPVISALSTNHNKFIVNTKQRTIVTDNSQMLQRHKINKASFENTAPAHLHHHISNSTNTNNYKRHIITNQYRLSIPLSNSNFDMIQSGAKVADMNIQLYNAHSSHSNIDKTTVKSPILNHSQIQETKWKNVISNKNESVTSLISFSNVNDITNRMFNDSVGRISLSPENVLTVVHNDTRMLEDGDGGGGVGSSQHENSTRISLNQWPVKHSAIVEGNLVLGGLMMVHEREDTVTCGPVMAQGGVQALEAMLYTLDWLNEHDIVPGVKIGAHILDDCDKDTYGLEMAVDFIKGSISNIDGAEYNCNKTTVRKVISGVVGAASSVTSIQVANLLRLFRIPQVSFFSTSPELSNKQRFEYFTRTIPSDHYQVKAMVDIIIKMGWSYVSIIYEESNYGIKAYEELEDLLAKNQICIAIKEKLVKDSGVAEETAYDNIVQKLLTKPRARGCIIFGSDQEVAGVMRAVSRNNATGAFYWIGSDGWSARGLVSNKNEPEVEGTLSVQPQANPVDGFEEYFLNLTVENNKRNPWFFEFWEDHFQCRYPNTSRTPYNQKYKSPCTTKERLTKHNTAFEDQLQFVSDAVMAFAYAFRDMHADLCHGNSGLCDAMRPIKGTELLKYLRKVEFQGLSGDNFHFDKNGDGPARYNIIHFKQVSPGKYKWVRVGKYLEGELRLNTSEIQFRLDNSQAPESVCSSPCRVGQAKKYVEGESCCWHCLDCTQYQIRHATDQTRCVACPQGTLPDETHSYCRDIPEEFLKPDSGWAIGAMSFSASGILITLFVGGVFVKNNDTPIVRASGRELSYVLLIGILLCYLVTFTLVLKPTDIVCGIQRFAAGFCFTVVYAALLTKTNRISRIFNKSKKSAKRPSFISPRSQLIICGLLVGIQILINAVWMVIDPAKARHHYPMREDNLLVCNSYIDASYMIAFSYPIILIVVCTVYAVLTRKIPEDFNESKHIGFTMYTTCVIWLAFVPLYFGTGNHVALRITSMSVTISLSASVTIACLFSPKLYIILIHPERNIRRGRGPFALKSTTNITRTNDSSMISTVTLTAATCDQNKAVKRHTTATTDCSTQSELYGMEMKDRKNGKIPQNLVTRSTQTLMNNNGKEINIVLSPTIESIDAEESFGSVKSLNVSKIGNGPVNQNNAVL